MPESRATVAITRTLEKHRSHDRVLALVREAIDLIGGISAFVKPGDTVLLKPNQTVFYSAEEGCTTDPLVVGALIRLAKQAGAARVMVGEASGGFFDSIQCMRITGMAAVAEREGAELVDLGSNDVHNRSVAIPHGQVIKAAPIPQPLLDADVVIDVPKAKNHHTDPISGALKNWMGCVNRHWRMDNHGDSFAYARFMDIMSVTRPHLCVADAIICGEGDGPIANIPRWCGCVLASTDPVAMDVAICRLMGHDWRESHHIREALQRGIGVAEPIDFIGVPLEQVAFHSWSRHRDFTYLPINFLVGEHVSLPGTVGHVKSVIDSMLRRGELNYVIWLKGTPTIMIGETDDPNFEQHLKEGPYIVFDNAAKPKYKDDPRVHFVPGHPVTATAMPELFKGFGLSLPAQAVMKLQQLQRRGVHTLQYGSTMRKVSFLAKPLVTAGLIAGGVAIAASLLNRSSVKRAHAQRLASRLSQTVGSGAT